MKVTIQGANNGDEQFQRLIRALDRGQLTRNALVDYEGRNTDGDSGEPLVRKDRPTGSDNDDEGSNNDD